MFFHNCGSEAVVEITGMFKFLSRPVLGKTYLLARRGSAIINSEVVETIFYCQGCNKSIPENEVVVRCSECGVEIPLSKAFKGNSNSYVFCDAHKEDGYKVLSTIVKRISIKTA